MNIARTSHVIIAIVVVLCAVALACSLTAQHYASLADQAYETRRLMFGYVDQLASGSDRLTNSVRAYASTGDRRYFDQFQRELKVDRSRDEAVAGLRRIGLEPAELELIDRAKRNSDALVLIENKAFEAVDRGDVPGAIKIVFGPEFTTTKATIMDS